MIRVYLSRVAHLPSACDQGYGNRPDASRGLVPFVCDRSEHHRPREPGERHQRVPAGHSFRVCVSVVEDPDGVAVEAGNRFTIDEQHLIRQIRLHDSLWSEWQGLSDHGEVADIVDVK
jgi:hypothetical protein